MAKDQDIGGIPVLAGARSEPDSPAPVSAGGWTLEEVGAELSFVIGERMADILRIQRERKETSGIKAVRIAVCEKMLARTKAAREIVRAAPELYAVLKELVETLRREAPGTPLNNHRFDALGIRANDALARAAPFLARAEGGSQ